MSEFNLIDEPWIPVRYPDGRYEELGIRDTLLRASEIATIEDQSPLVVASLHRLLLAVLYRALEGPTDIDEAKRVFRDGIPIEKVLGYLDKWRERFWLFDDRFPIYQLADYVPAAGKTWKPWLELAAEHNADNAKVLWDHTSFTAPGRISRGMAARWLVACQAFALGGGKSDFGNRRSALSATAVMTLPVGRSLHDTLIFCLVPQNRDVTETDRAVWEEEVPATRSAFASKPERAVTGCVGLYTWRTRAVKFDQRQDSMVEGIAFAQGVTATSQSSSDPMLGYVVNPGKGRLPRRFHERGVWRDFDSLLPDSAGLAPAVIDNASLLTRGDAARRPNAVIVLGQGTDQAKVNYWRMEQFVLPLAEDEEPSLRARTRSLLDEAQSAANVLERAFKAIARLTIAKAGRPLQEDKWVAGKWKAGDVSRFLRRTVPPDEGDPEMLSAYWATLEYQFQETIALLATKGDLEVARFVWLKAIRNALREAWQEHGSRTDIWTMRARAQAIGPLARELARIDQAIHALSPVQEQA